MYTRGNDKKRKMGSNLRLIIASFPSLTLLVIPLIHFNLFFLHIHMTLFRPEPSTSQCSPTPFHLFSCSSLDLAIHYSFIPSHFFLPPLPHFPPSFSSTLHPPLSVPPPLSLSVCLSAASAVPSSSEGTEQTCRIKSLTHFGPPPWEEDESGTTRGGPLENTRRRRRRTSLGSRGPPSPSQGLERVLRSSPGSVLSSPSVCCRGWVCCWVCHSTPYDLFLSLPNGKWVESVAESFVNRWMWTVVEPSFGRWVSVSSSCACNRQVDLGSSYQDNQCLFRVCCQQGFLQWIVIPCQRKAQQLGNHLSTRDSVKKKNCQRGDSEMSYTLLSVRG